jgi:hypothetical protein
MIATASSGESLSNGVSQAIPTSPEVPVDAPTPPGQLIVPIVAAGPAATVDPDAISSSMEDPPPLPETPVAKSSNPWDTSNGLGGTPFSAAGFGARPSGFSGPSAGFAGSDTLLTLKDGLSLSAMLSGTYDTNPSQGYGPVGDSGQGDFFMTLGGTAAYLSKASEWTYGATYTGGYNQFFNQTDLSGYNQNAGASVNYQGGPFTATFNVGCDIGSGANRYYASVVDEIRFNYGLNARYRISSKTSLTGNFSQNFTSASGGGSSGTDSFNLGASALWRYSPLTEFGPGIRYTSQSGDTQQGRTSIGPTMTVNYKLSKKVSLNSQVGVDFAEYEDGQSADPTLAMLIGLNYQASRLWGMNLSLNRSTEADPARAGQYSEMTSLRIGYNRRIRRAVWNLGLSYETTTTEVPDQVTTGYDPNVADRDYLSFDTSLGMPVFADTCNASVFIRYSDHSGSASETWDSLQTGFSISRSF